MIELLLKFGPWLLVAISGVFAFITHQNGKIKVAKAKEDATNKVDAANANVQVAIDNLNSRKTADVQADADAAKTAATAAQERTNVENDQAALSDDAAREQLSRLLHSTNNPGSGQGSAGTDPGRG